MKTNHKSMNHHQYLHQVHGYNGQFELKQYQIDINVIKVYAGII